MTPRKFDFDYNYDPEGTSIVKPDPYADQDPSEAITTTHHGFTYAAKTFSRNATPTRSRSNTPERPPIPSSPSPEYLAISQEPSHKPTDIFAHRKLLILDLNGTLVFRSPHVKRNAYQRMPGQRALRSVHRRPYLLSFEQYLFHPRTRAWLDTMVWSSAQPHSVKDMTEQCFPNHGDDLLAIWARDTLGLKEEDYYRKTQTTKDLAKPWSNFREHSAKTTLLLDDSPLKAHLQPWNHLCIREYVSEMRKNDVKVREAERMQEAIEPDEDHTHKRKKKPMNFAEKVAQAVEEARGLEYDSTLLAIVGVLDAVKEETNVAGWMRTGGLVDVPASSVPLKKRRNTGDQENGSTPPPSPGSSAEQQEETGVPMTEKPEGGLWFDHPDAFAYWTERGRRALEELGIEVNHGVSA